METFLAQGSAESQASRREMMRIRRYAHVKYETFSSPLESLIADFDCSHYTILQYKVLFLPFKAAGFTTEHPLDVPLQEISVEIGTTYAHGPRPISYSSTFSPQ